MRLIPLLLVAAAAAGCASTDVAAIHEEGEKFELAKDESALWEDGREIEYKIVRDGGKYENAELQSYLQGIMDKLLTNYPDLPDVDPHVLVLRSPTTNAFALPHGGMFITTGMLARMENESQLATVFGHELTHFLGRHSLEERRVAARKEIIANLTTILMGGVGAALGGEAGAESMVNASARAMQTWRVSSISGYSRELEYEADRGGLELIIEAGYDPRESPRVFEHLLAELEEQGVDEPYFFASHPKLQNRIENYRAILESRNMGVTPGGHIGEDEYLAQIEPVLLDNVEMDISAGRHASAEGGLTRYLQRHPESARAYYLKGQSIRHRSSDDESLSRALEAYRRAAELGGAPPEAYKELGMAYRNDDDLPESAKYFRKYLEANPGALDAPIIAKYIRDGERAVRKNE